MTRSQHVTGHVGTQMHHTGNQEQLVMMLNATTEQVQGRAGNQHSSTLEQGLSTKSLAAQLVWQVELGQMQVSEQ